MKFAWPRDAKAAVSLSFDDARPSQVDLGVPVLDKHGIKGTFYLTPSAVPQRLEAWKTAVKAGHEMGNHTKSHFCSGNFSFARGKALEELSLEGMEQDILAANDETHSMLGVRPVTFAYPCGQTFVGRGLGLKSYIPVVAKHFVVGRGAFSEIYCDPSYSDLARADSLDADEKTFPYLKSWIERAVAEGAWLIWMVHDVGTTAARQTMTVEVLDGLCAYLKDPQNGIYVDTVASVGDYIKKRRG